MGVGELGVNGPVMGSRFWCGVGVGVGIGVEM